MSVAGDGGTKAVSPSMSILADSGTTPANLELADSATCEACTFVWRPDRGGLLALKMVNMRCEVHGEKSGFKTVPWSRVNHGNWAVGCAS
jgi:hypothetical protein